MNTGFVYRLIWLLITVVFLLYSIFKPLQEGIIVTASLCVLSAIFVFISYLLHTFRNRQDLNR